MANTKPSGEQAEAGATIERARQEINAPVMVNPKYKRPAIDHIIPRTRREYRCTCCGKLYTKQEGNFLKAGDSLMWQANSGYMPVCKVCAEALYKSLVSFYSGNEEHAMRHWCCIWGYFYDTEASVSAGKKKDNCRALTYPSRINAKQIALRGTSYLDTVRRETEMVRVSVANEMTDEEAAQFVYTKGIAKKWGHGYTAEEYEWLEEQEDDWRTRVECKTKAQEELIRAICIAQFNIHKAQQGGGKFSEAMKTFQDLLASCNLQPRQAREDESSDQQTFGTLIRQLEEERPVPKAEPEWEDVDGIKNYIDTYFLGHLCKLVHLDNDCSEKYEREMAKYTVQPPAYENDDEAVDLSLLDKYGERGNKQ